jgi:hypothetical protein
MTNSVKADSNGRNHTYTLDQIESLFQSAKETRWFIGKDTFKLFFNVIQILKYAESAGIDLNNPENFKTYMHKLWRESEDGIYGLEKKRKQLRRYPL